MEVIEGGELGHAGARVLLADLSTSAPSTHTQALPPSHTTPPVAHTHLAGNRYVASAQNSVLPKKSMSPYWRGQYRMEVETGGRRSKTFEGMRQPQGRSELIIKNSAVKKELIREMNALTSHRAASHPPHSTANVETQTHNNAPLAAGHRPRETRTSE